MEIANICHERKNGNTYSFQTYMCRLNECREK